MFAGRAKLPPKGSSLWLMVDRGCCSIGCFDVFRDGWLTGLGWLGLWLWQPINWEGNNCKPRNQSRKGQIIFKMMKRKCKRTLSVSNLPNVLSNCVSNLIWKFSLQFTLFCDYLIVSNWTVNYPIFLTLKWLTKIHKVSLSFFLNFICFSWNKFRSDQAAFVAQNFDD